MSGSIKNMLQINKFFGDYLEPDKNGLHIFSIKENKGRNKISVVMNFDAYCYSWYSYEFETCWLAVVAEAINLKIGAIGKLKSYDMDNCISTVKNLITNKIIYNQSNQTLESVVLNEKCRIMKIRGWSLLQKLFPTVEEAAEYQDYVGEYIAEAINIFFNLI